MTEEQHEHLMNQLRDFKSYVDELDTENERLAGEVLFWKKMHEAAHEEVRELQAQECDERIITMFALGTILCLSIALSAVAVF